jgi:hypothetical protein
MSDCPRPRRKDLRRFERGSCFLRPVQIEQDFAEQFVRRFIE